MENELTFVAPEGVYTVTEEHRPTALGLHTINVIPVLHPTKLSSAIVKYPTAKGANSQVLSQLLGGSKEKELKKEKAPSKEREDGLSASSSETPEEAPGSPEIPISSIPEGVHGTPSTPHEQLNTIFSHSPVAIGKKKNIARPKHNMRTTSSTFITRLQNVDNLNKVLQSKQGDVNFFFYNSAKTFVWTEAGNKAKEPLARIFFAAYPTCHDVNTATLSPEHIDVIIGFSTGDILWFDPISSRYARLNKQGRISISPCTAIKWVPSSPNLFLVAHADGTIIIYDKEREDGIFTPQEPTAPQPPPSIETSLDDRPPSSSESHPGEWNSFDSIFVTMPPWHPVTVGSVGLPSSKSEKEKVAKNPVSHWKVSKKSIIDFVFSPDAKYIAAISEDGCLRVIDTVAEQLVDCYSSYFGAFTCTAWSPDSRYILTGGQDDLVTIYSPWEQRVVARCQGHSSFVSALAFDDIRCDGRTYRFGSVGEDNKLILWDFSSGALHRPKLYASHHQRMSMTSSISLALRRRGESTLYLPPMGSPNGESPVSRYHPAPSRNEVAIVQPVLTKHIESDLLTDIVFLARGLLTSNKTGHVKFWIRPLANPSRHHIRHGMTRTSAGADARNWDI